MQRWRPSLATSLHYTRLARKGDLKVAPIRKGLELMPQPNSPWLGWYLEIVDRVIRQNQQFIPLTVLRSAEMQRQQLQRIA